MKKKTKMIVGGAVVVGAAVVLSNRRNRLLLNAHQKTVRQYLTAKMKGWPSYWDFVNHRRVYFGKEQ